MPAKYLLRMSIKDIAPDGSFEGDLAVYNNVDLGGDIIVPGAFTKTILDRGNTVPLLWQHKSDAPIGLLTLTDSAEALRVKGQLELGVQSARDAYLLIKARIVRGLSIGFDTVKDQVENGVRLLKELRLWEGSIVTFPMNERALITSVKAWKDRQAERKADFTTEFAEVQLQDVIYQIFMALRNSVSSTTWDSETTREEKISILDASWDQAKQQFMSIYGPYLDWLAQEYGGMQYYAAPGREAKAGRRLSAATADSLKSAVDHMASCQGSAQSALDLLAALMEEEAVDEDTSKSRAAVISASEPVVDHSAVELLISEMRSLVQAATN